MKRLLPIILVGLVLFGCNDLAPATASCEGWALVYKNDGNGQTLYGDKAVLLQAVRNGNAIRVGWGRRSATDTTRSVEHVAEASFLTIMDNTEVFAQIDRIIGQAPARIADSLKIRFRPSNQWTRMMGTNGYASGLMYDYVADTLVNAGRDQKAGTSWFVQCPNGHQHVPLWEN